MTIVTNMPHPDQVSDWIKRPASPSSVDMSSGVTTYNDGPRIGRKRAADPRDNDYLARDHVLGITPEARFKLRASALVRPYKYYRQGFTLDQGYSSRCTVFAKAQLILTGPIMQDLTAWGLANGYQSLDHMLWVAYNWAQQNDEWEGENYDGTSTRAAAQWFRMQGFYPNFYHLTSVDEVVDYIMLHGPVPTGTDWFSGMDQRDSRGFIRPTGRWRGGHEYLLDGVNKTEEFFRMHQSWGKDPYEVAKISFQDFDYLFRLGADALAIPEVRVPRVKKVS